LVHQSAQAAKASVQRWSAATRRAYDRTRPPRLPGG
jgi:hypothetical protein